MRDNAVDKVHFHESDPSRGQSELQSSLAIGQFLSLVIVSG
jgi:hypothetical protein